MTRKKKAEPEVVMQTEPAAVQIETPGHFEPPPPPDAPDGIKNNPPGPCRARWRDPRGQDLVCDMEKGHMERGEPQHSARTFW